MIDDISEPGAWARELKARPRRCDHCIHYLVRRGVPLCSLDRPLIPCGDYQREPGSDDDEQ